MHKWLDANCVGIRNVGYLIIFGGCYGLGGVGKGASSASSASGPDDWLWEDTGSLPSSYAWKHGNDSTNSVDNSYEVTDGGFQGWGLSYCKGPDGEQLEFNKVEGNATRDFDQALRTYLEGKDNPIW